MPPVAAAAAAIAGAASAAVGTATIAAEGALLAAGVANAAAYAGIIAGVLDAIVTIGATLALSAVGGLIVGKPKIGGDYGTQIDWKADPQAGVPYVIGRTGVAGNIVLKDVAGDKNRYLWVSTVLSGAGPVKSVTGYQADSVLVGFGADGGEGASGGQLTTSLAAASPAGATVIVVGGVQGFAAGQTITVGGEGVVIKTVFGVGSTLQLKSGLVSAHPVNAQVVGPSSTAFYLNRMWRKVGLGASGVPALTFTATNSKDTPANHAGIPATWNASSKLSGLAHTIQAFEFDAAVYVTGEPKPLQVVEGVTAYDPRLDSTYPGGAGPQRSGDESTWAYSDNPYLHALTWCLGRRANGVRTLGVGAPIAAIDVAAFVGGANVADAHGWRVGGQLYSTDAKWAVLTSMLQAGCGRPLKLGAMISCMVNAPKVSLDTLTGADVIGEATISGTQPRRERINAIWPRYREEAQGWQIVPTEAPVTVPAYAAVDGGLRTKEVEYTLAAGGPDHVATLARYDIENSRETGPHTLPCLPRWMGYQPGDCITVDEPELGLNGQKCLILGRSQDPATMAVTLTLRSETDAKHAFALGMTADPPPTPALTGVDPAVVSTPLASAWAAMGGASTSPSGQSLPAVVLTGACTDPNVASIVVGYRLAGSQVVADWATLQAGATGTTITGLAPQTGYVARLQYRSVRGVVGPALELAPVTTGGVATDWASVTDPLSRKPDDNATVGARVGEGGNLVLYDPGGAQPVVLQPDDIITALGQAGGLVSVGGARPAADILADLDLASLNLADQLLRYGTYRAETDQIIFVQGVPVRVVVEQLGVTTAGHQVFITSLQSVDGSGVGKAVFAVNSDGHIIGAEYLNDGTKGSVAFAADAFQVVSATGAPRTIFSVDTVAGRIGLTGDVEIDGSLTVAGSLPTPAYSINSISASVSTSGNSQGAMTQTTPDVCGLTVTSTGGLVDVTGFVTAKHTGGASPINTTFVVTCDGAVVSPLFEQFFVGGYKSQTSVGFQHNPGPGPHTYTIRNSSGPSISLGYYGYYMKIEERKTSR